MGLLTQKEPKYLGNLKAMGRLNQPRFGFWNPVLLISIQTIHKWSQMKAVMFIFL
jgi:hypothetical protein